MKKFTPQTVGLLLLLSSSLPANTIRVPQDQPTIQAGINAAVNGDTVLVAPGTYSVNLNLNGKNILLKSAAGPEATILIPASNGTPIIQVVSGEDTTATIDGFRFLRGNALNGGGILFNNSSGAVSNNIFDSCTATGGTSGNGGGVACIGALTRVRISNNVFKNGLGGGGNGQADAFFCLASTVEFSRNLISNNSSAAVIFLFANSTGKIINNTIANNAYTALSYQDGSVGELRNNIFYNNPIGGMINISAGLVTVEYNDFLTSPASGSPLGTGNISQDPLFVGGSPFSYELQPNSPCIDAGDPSTEVPPFGGARVDMGAFEIPQNFALFAPRGNITLKKPQLIWSLLRDSNGIVVPASFRAVLAPSCDFNLADSSPVLRDTVWKFPYKLAVDRDHCWRMIAVPDADDTTIITDSVHFVVGNPPLGPILPSNNSTLNIRRPTFVWNSIRDTSIPESFTYQVVLSTDSAFGVAETSSVVSDTAWKTNHNLTVGQTYHWKIVAAGSDWDTVISNASRFNIVNPTLTPILPPNNSTFKIRQPTFVWNSIRDTSIPESFTYRVVLSTDSVFGAAETSSVVSDTAWKTNHSLIVGQPYYWKIVASSNAGDSVISNVSRFNIVNPTLTPILPPNNSTFKIRRPTFVWNSVRDTSIPEVFTYQVVFSTGNTFNVAETSTVVSDTVWKMDRNLVVGQTYYWKIVAAGDSGDTIISTPSKFTIIGSFDLFLPAANSILKVRRPTFIWQTVQDTSVGELLTYRVILSKDSGFTVPEITAPLIDTVWKADHTLDANQIYFWKVIALSDSGDTAFSSAAKFTIMMLITLYLPGDNATVEARRPTFIWQSVSDTSFPETFIYHIILSANSAFSMAETSAVLSDTVWEVERNLVVGQTYHWKVVAFGDSGGTIVSGPGKFTVGTPFSLFLPHHLSTVKIRRPTFIWQTVSDTSTAESFAYRVIFAKDVGFSEPETSALISDTVWKVERTLDANQIYFWKVFAFTDSGDTSVSGVARFTVAPIPFYLHLPSSTVRITQPTFAWQKVQDTSITGSYIYRTILSKTADFSAAETSAILTDTVWKAPHKLKLYSTYYWKVESILEGVGSTFNNEVSFNVQPPPIFPLLPLDATIVRERQPTLVWSTVQDTSVADTFSYQALISKNPDFSNPMQSPVSSDTTWQVPFGLEIGSFYFWKPLAFYSGDNDTVGPERFFYFREQPSRIIIPEDRPRIQEGIDLALKGDTVWVKPGIYYENIFFKGKRIKVISEGGPEVTTIAKYTDGLELVNFSTSEDSNTLLSGFTITGANQISYGAAIKIVNASPRIENNHIVGNSGVDGAIYVHNGFPRIRQNLVAKDSGFAAIHFSDISGGEVVNCTISDNVGDGIQVSSRASVRVVNCIISFNSGYGMRSLAGNNTSSTITFNDVFGNGFGHFFAILPSTSNINADPLFLGGEPFNYHLFSTSPCMEAGDPSFPAPAGGGSRIDMGAFEFIATRGDLSGDGAFGPVDVVLQLNCAFWGTGNCNLAMTDVDCDGQLAPADVVIELSVVFLGAPFPC